MGIEFGCVLLRVAVCVLLLSGASVVPAWAKPATASASMKASLRAFLQTWDGQKDTRYLAAFDDLNGDGKPEAIVYLTGPRWCGDLGCNTLVLTRKRRAWRLMSNITVSNPPIRVLNRRVDGWRTIAIEMRSGPKRPGWAEGLSFNGKSYPSDPTNPFDGSVRPLRGTAPGRVVIASTKGAKRLFRNPKRAGHLQTLVTKHYIVTITSHCPGGAVDCGHVTYHGVSRTTGEGITLQGSALHTPCRHGTAHCFTGYEFKHGDLTYEVGRLGWLGVSRGKSEALVGEQGRWQPWHYVSTTRCNYEFDYPSGWEIAQLSDQGRTTCQVRLRPENYREQMAEENLSEDAFSLYVEVYVGSFLRAADNAGFDFYQGKWATVGRQGMRNTATVIKTGQWSGVRGTATVGCVLNHHMADGIGVVLCSQYDAVMQDPFADVWSMEGGDYTDDAFDMVLSSFRFRGYR